MLFRSEKVQLRAKYGSGIQKADSELTGDQKLWLSGLKDKLTLNLSGKRITLCHGAPWDINEYIYGDSSDLVWEKLASVEGEVIIMGHSHYPIVREMSGKLIMNPGSVGQPRDGAGGASWGVFDTEMSTAQIISTEYDVKGVIAEALSIDPEVPYLQEVLKRNNIVKLRYREKHQKMDRGVFIR